MEELGRSLLGGPVPPEELRATLDGRNGLYVRHGLVCVKDQRELFQKSIQRRRSNTQVGELIGHYFVDTIEDSIKILKEEAVLYVLEAPFFNTYRPTQPFWEHSPVFQNLDQESYSELLHREGDIELYRIKA